jgi:hypothetical protein
MLSTKVNQHLRAFANFMDVKTDLSNSHTTNQRRARTNQMTMTSKCASIIMKLPDDIGQNILEEACIHVGTASVLTWVTQFERESPCRIHFEVR